MLLLTLSSVPATAADAAAEDGGVVAERIKRSKSNYAEQDKLLEEARELFAKKEFEKALAIIPGSVAVLDTIKALDEAEKAAKAPSKKARPRVEQ